MAASAHGHLRIVRDADVGELAACVARHPAGLTQKEADILEDLRGYDPSCRYASDPTRYPGHVCVRNTGEPVRLDETCVYEARAQLHVDGECTACGGAITNGRGSVTLPDGRRFAFHSGDCFMRADEAIATLEAARDGAS